MYNWLAVVDGDLHLQWGVFKPNTSYFSLTLDQLLSPYGLLLPIAVDSLNVLSFMAGEGPLPTGQSTDIVGGFLITSKGKVYHVVITPEGKPIFRLIPTGAGSHFITADNWAAEESLETIVSYTRDPDEIIEASEKVMTTNPGLRHYLPLADLAAQIELRKPSLPLSTLFAK